MSIDTRIKLRWDALEVGEHPHLDWESGAWRYQYKQLENSWNELCMISASTFDGLMKSNRASILTHCFQSLQAQPLLSSRLRGDFHLTVFKLTPEQSKTEVGWLFRNLDSCQLDALAGLQSQEIWPVMSRDEFNYVTQQLRKYKGRRAAIHLS